MNIVLWPTWIILAVFGVLALYGIIGIVRMQRAGKRQQVNNLLWAELSVCLFIASRAIILITLDEKNFVSEMLMVLALLIQAVQALVAANKSDDPEQPSV